MSAYIPFAEMFLYYFIRSQNIYSDYFHPAVINWTLTANFFPIVTLLA